MIIQPPDPAGDVRQLHRKVAELCEVINALANMTVIVEGRVRMIGRLEVRSGSSLLIIEEGSEVASLGA